MALSSLREARVDVARLEGERIRLLREVSLPLREDLLLRAVSPLSCRERILLLRVVIPLGWREIGSSNRE